MNKQSFQEWHKEMLAFSGLFDQDGFCEAEPSQLLKYIYDNEIRQLKNQNKILKDVAYSAKNFDECSESMVNELRQRAIKALRECGE